MTNELNFDTKDDLLSWLSGRPFEFEQIIALRSVLRIFPLVSFTRQKIHKSTMKQLILQSWRALFLAYVEQNQLDGRKLDDSISTGAFITLKALSSRTSSFGHSSAIEALANVVIGEAPKAIANSIDALTDQLGSSINKYWTVISLECEILEKHGSKTLSSRHLWFPEFDNVAGNFRKAPAQLDIPIGATKNLFKTLGPEWKIISDWYALQLRSQNHRNDQLLLRAEAIKLRREQEITLAAQKESFWEISDWRSAEQILSEAAEILGAGAKAENQENASKKELSDFVLQFLKLANSDRSIDQIRSGLEEEAIKFVDSSLRRTLGQLTDSGQIERVRRGLYRHLNQNNIEPEQLTQRGSFAFQAVNGDLDRIPTLPNSSERENPTQQKLLNRLKEKLHAFTTSLGNSISKYPHLSLSISDYQSALNAPTLDRLQVDDVWIAGTGIIAQARSFAALNPNEHLTQPLEPQQQALLAEIAHLHGAFIMGFAEGRELVERSPVPLLTKEELRALLQHERAIVRWLLESEKYQLSVNVKTALEFIDHNLEYTSEGVEELVQAGYPAVRNLLIFTGQGLGHATRIAGGATLIGVPVHLAVQGALAFITANYSHIVGFAASSPELHAYLKYHLDRLEVQHLAKTQDEK